MTPLATLLSGELLSFYGLAGIGLIVASLLLLALGNKGSAAMPRSALFWMGLAGLATAGYVLCDAQGVRRAGSPLAYGFVVSATHSPGAYEDFVEFIVPELQRRGVFRKDYAGTTLRENLGIPVPAASARRTE